MENIVYVKLLRLHSSHIRLEEKKTPSKEHWKTRNRASDGFTNLILSGGLTGGDYRYSSLSLGADQYQESGHYALLKVLCAQSICYYFSSAGCI